MYGMILVAAISLADLNFDVLESFYWDCDTMFMKGELDGQDTMTCLAITEEFQKHFVDNLAFRQYWNQQNTDQWQKRGYSRNNKHKE